MIVTATIQLEQDRDPALVRDRLALFLDAFLRELSVDGVHVIQVEDSDDDTDETDIP